MKKLILFIVVLMAGIGIANAQDGINYQAVVRDNNGDLMKNEAVALEFNIVKTATSGTVVYTETHALTSNNFGNIVAIIGQGTPTLNTFAAIDWASDKHFLNVKINGTDMGTTEMLSVPYALHAKTADALTNPAWNKTGTTVSNTTDEISIGTTTPSAEKLTVQASALSPAELVDLRVTDFGANNDVINMDITTTGTDVGQFLEMHNNGLNIYSINTDGEFHTPNRTGNANMLPIAYGTVSSSGTLNAHSSNITNVTLSGTGIYDIIIADETINWSDYIVLLTSYSNSFANLSWGAAGGLLYVYSRNLSTDVYMNTAFSFIVYKP